MKVKLYGKLLTFLSISNSSHVVLQKHTLCSTFTFRDLVTLPGVNYHISVFGVKLTQTGLLFSQFG